MKTSLKNIFSLAFFYLFYIFIIQAIYCDPTEYQSITVSAHVSGLVYVYRNLIAFSPSPLLLPPCTPPPHTHLNVHKQKWNRRKIQ